MKQNICAWALAAASVVTASPEKVHEDSLVSSHLSKRGLNADGDYVMSFFHVNDVHAHLDEFASSGADCTNPSRGCYGGYARIKHAVDELRPQHEDSLWLNAGDEFQGTLFYTYYKGEKIAETINQLGFDAMTLGNHEFDGGDDELGDFLANLTFPIISANIRSEHPVLNQTIIPYKIFEKQGIAIIGCTTPTTINISRPGPGTQFLDVIEHVQAAIDEIKATTSIKRIVALTHIGYDQDQILAQSTTGLSLIIGGHSHTPLGNMGSSPQGAYPTITKDTAGNEVFIVTAYRWGEYLGYIDVTFDDEGRAISYDGGPVHLDNTTVQDQELQRQIKEWRAPFEELAAQVIGFSNVELVQSTCQTEECTLGNAMADAIQYYRDGFADFSLINAGGIRAAIDAGDITRGEVLTSFPFGNAVTEITMSGADVLRLLEGCVSRVSKFNGNPLTSGFQISKTLKVQYNPNLTAGSRLVRALINGQPIDTAANYVIATLDFVAGGGDNIFPIQTGFVPLDLQDEVLVRYFNQTSPINTQIEGRIEKVAEIPGGNSTTTTPVSTPVSTPASTPISTPVSTPVSSSVSIPDSTSTLRTSTRTRSCKSRATKTLN
ncbi:unnamed protein product [Clonostachys rosea f. rosea IK726]|uniref:5'-Nucleotidase C-terminal domain-containing protein n=2 Tax=Bionectria ochroleuca TaxID=29856 RepID=A0A0B7KI40_BIOOC|nr:unnamed protein product [Clonostachys rosea f. rosea IK726]